MAKDSADSLLSLLNDILDFSKIEAGKLELDPTEFNLHDHLHDTMRSMALRAGAKGLELVCHVTPGVPDVVVGDLGRLRQIIINLVGNAIKFTEQGEVVLQVDTVSRSEDSYYLHFSVADTGIGIAPEKQRLIFEPFAQADSSTTRKHGGTGLGLAITSSLVSMMGGRMWLESVEGHGSTFHFTAMLGVSHEHREPTTVVQPRQLRGLTVLVVDDNATNRRVLGEMLTNWGMNPTLVDGGRAALAELSKALRAHRPYDLHGRLPPGVEDQERSGARGGHADDGLVGRSPRRRRPLPATGRGSLLD
jgi:hypothetical protein